MKRNPKLSCVYPNYMTLGVRKQPFSLFLRSIKVEIGHVPVSTSLEFQHIFRLAGTDFVIVKDVPIVIVFVRIGNLFPVSTVGGLDLKR